MFALSSILRKATGLLALSAVVAVSNGQVKPNLAPASGPTASKQIASGTHPATEVQKADATARLRKKSASFIENKGQWDSRAKFFNRQPGMDAWVTKNGWVLNSFSQHGDTQVGHVVGMTFVGATSKSVEGRDDKAFDREFVSKGKFSQKIVAKSFGSVLTKDLYPGIDAVYYLDGGKPRYDLQVKPNVDASVAKFKVEGTKNVAVDGKGNLVVGTNQGKINFGKLYAYQMVDGAKKSVPVAFKGLGNGTFGFSLGQYDHSKKLVIDPLIYGTLWGGDNGWDETHSIVTDNSQGTYIVGNTRTSRFPANFGPYRLTISGVQDAFIAKLQGDVYNRDYAAVFGGSSTDTADYVQVDRQGNIWIAGISNSVDFPGTSRDSIWVVKPDLSATGGTVSISVQNLADNTFTTRSVGFQLDPIEVQNAFSPSFSGLQCDTIHGNLLRMRFPNPLRVKLTIDSSGTFPLYVTNNVQSKQWVVRSTAAAPTAGTFDINFLDSSSVAHAVTLNFGDAPGVITTKVQAVMGSSWTAAFLPGAPGTAAFPANPIILTTTNNDVITGLNTGALTTPTSLELLFGTKLVVSQNTNRSNPTGGSASVAINGVVTTVPTVAGVLTAANINAAFPNTFPGPIVIASGGPVPSGSISVAGFLNAAPTVSVSAAGLTPHPVYTAYTYNYAYLMRWKKSSTTVLTPEVGSEKVLTWGGLNTDTTTQGFNIYKSLDTPSDEPVPFYIAGNSLLENDRGEVNFEFKNGSTVTQDVIPGWSSALGQIGYRLRATFDPLTNSFAVNMAGSGYEGDSSAAPIEIRGSVVDKDGNHIVAGTVFFGTNEDTSTASSPSFVTTSGIYSEGRLLRLNDLFVRKYDPSGALTNSGLIGGNSRDIAGGWDTSREVFTQGYDPRSSTTGSFTPELKEIVTGSAVGVDNAGNIYVTGITTSFNFPRTHGVFGEIFDQFSKVTVTKVSRDFTELIYSTHMRTSNDANPAGIGVGPGGEVFLTGNIHPASVNYPHAIPPPDDLTTVTNTGIVASSIPTTGDALRGGYNVGPNDPTQDGWFLVLNNTGTNLIYGSYIGGDLNDRCFAPFVDKFGDCWLTGYTAARRTRLFGPQTGPVNQIDDAVMTNQITALAYRSNRDLSAFSVGPLAYGMLDTVLGPDTPLAWPPYAFWPAMNESRDGFVQRYRFTLPILTDIQYSKPTLAGGLGNSTTGRVFINQAAPSPGVSVTLSMGNNTAASFQAGAPVFQQVITIPTGATSAPFTVFTNAVPTLTNVDITANLEGNILTRRLVVAPWLESLAVTPNNVVGGNDVQGRVRIFEAAPAGGVPVTLVSGDANFAQVPVSVTVPQGQTEAAFTITTSGVVSSTPVTISATFSGVGVSQQLTLNPASLFTFTLDPIRLSAGATTTGTIKLDGKPATGTTVTVRFPSGSLPAGYVATPSTIVFDPADTTQDPTVRTFKLKTPFEAAPVTRIITIERVDTLQRLSATLQVDTVDVTSIIVNDPNPVIGGATASVTVTLASPAGKGGAPVHIVSSNAAAKIQGDGGAVATDVLATVPEGATSRVVNITTTAVANDTFVSFTADRGLTTKTTTPPLTIKGVGYTLSITPGTVTGGTSATGKVTLSGGAPVGGLTVNLSAIDPGTSSSSIYASVPATLNFADGETVKTFAISTNPVPSNQTARIQAQVGSAPIVTADLLIKPTSITGITFTPNRTKGGRAVSCRITLDTPAGVGGAVITLTNSKTSICRVPVTVTIPEGKSTYVFSVVTYPVSRLQTATISGTYNGTIVANTLSVTR